MNMSPVSRLKKTWGKAKTAKFYILEVNLMQSFTYWEAQDRLWLEADIMLLVDICANSIRWTRQEIFTTTGPPWGEPPIALRLPTATEKGYRLISASLHSLWKHAGIDSVFYYHLRANIFYIFVCFLSTDCNSLLQSANQRYLFPEWRMCQSAAQWPCQLRG